MGQRASREPEVKCDGAVLVLRGTAHVRDTGVAEQPGAPAD